jgi:hypothetical protein
MGAAGSKAPTSRDMTPASPASMLPFWFVASAPRRQLATKMDDLLDEHPSQILSADPNEQCAYPSITVLA